MSSQTQIPDDHLHDLTEAREPLKVGDTVYIVDAEDYDSTVRRFMVRQGVIESLDGSGIAYVRFNGEPGDLVKLGVDLLTPTPDAAIRLEIQYYEDTLEHWEESYACTPTEDLANAVVQTRTNLSNLRTLLADADTVSDDDTMDLTESKFKHGDKVWKADLVLSDVGGFVGVKDTLRQGTVSRTLSNGGFPWVDWDNGRGEPEFEGSIFRTPEECLAELSDRLHKLVYRTPEARINVLHGLAALKRKYGVSDVNEPMDDDSLDLTEAKE